MRRWVVVGAILVAVFFAVTLGLAQNWGWSTPFALPAVISYRGHSYYVDTNDYVNSRLCFVSPAVFAPGYAPLRRAGSVFGWFTTSNPVLLPHYEWTRHLPFVLLVRDGRCLRYYTLPPQYGP